MADAIAPEKPDKIPESPTTARPMDFDDDQQETGTVQVDAPIEAPSATSTRASRSGSRVRFAEEEDAPPKPPRAASPMVQAEHTLIEAFPSIDAKVVKAVLVASGGQLEPAFNALLSMSDPSFAEEAPPPQPPRPTMTAAQRRQLEQDEMYARQLAGHFNVDPRAYSPGAGYGALPPRTDSRGYSAQRQGPNFQGPGQGRGKTGKQAAPGEEKEYSFLEDELPQIRENLKQGFLSTQTKVNKWISDFQKRIDGDDSDEGPSAQASQGSARPSRQNYGPSQADQLYGIQKNADMYRSRRSTDYDRYDADPQVLNDNFEGLEMRDEEDIPPPKPNRPSTNPNLFKPTPQPPQSGPVDEVDALYSNPKTPSNSTPSSTNIPRQPSPSSGKSKKWQPLTSLAPAPDAEDNDPFALGESDDDKDAGKKTDLRAGDTERLKKAASASDRPTGEGLEAAETGAGGTRNKEVEELLSKGS